MAIQSSTLTSTVRQYRPAYLALLAFGFFNPILYLGSPLFAEQIFDRISLSRNVVSLFMLASVAIFMLVMFTLLDYLRSQTLLRIGVGLDAKLTAEVFEALHREKNVAAASPSALPLADLTVVREFLTGPMVGTLIDAVWSPLFIALVSFVHPLFGVLSAIMIGLSAWLTWLTGRVAKDAAQSQMMLASAASDFGSAVWRNAETLRALGMLKATRDHWYGMHFSALGFQDLKTRKYLRIAGVLKFIRNSQYVFTYVIGCLLYFADQISLSAMVYTGLILARGIGPIDAAIASWKGIAGFYGSWQRLEGLLQRQGEAKKKIELPSPSGALVLSRVVACAPDSDRAILTDISLTVQPGRVLGVIGPSGSGKSCLARVAAGIWKPRRGTVSLGEHDLQHWDDSALGQHIGYVPQDIDLLPGTLGQNISRFEPAAATSPEKLHQAVAVSGLGDVVKSLPHGLNTFVGAGGSVLSGGQRQRIALARAIYGMPYLVVMDEPNSSLDAAGETALVAAMNALRAANRIVIVATHKMSLLNHCDDVAVLTGGVLQATGPRSQVLERLPKMRAAPTLSLVESRAETEA